MNFGSPSRSLRAGKLNYANDAMRRWFVTGSADDAHLPSSVRLNPISLKSSEQTAAQPPLIWCWAPCNPKIFAENGKEFDEDVSKNPWGYVAENLQQDLLSSFQYVRKAMESKELEEKPTLVAGFGKIIFHGRSINNVEAVEMKPVAETTLRQMKKHCIQLSLLHLCNMLLKLLQRLDLILQQKRRYTI